MSAGMSGVGSTRLKNVASSRDSNPHPAALCASNILSASASSVTDLARCSSSSSEPSVSQSGTTGIGVGAGSGGGAGVDLWSCYVPNLPGSGPKSTSTPIEGGPTTTVPNSSPSNTPNTASNRIVNSDACLLARRQSVDHTGTGGCGDSLNRFKLESGEAGEEQEINRSAQTSLVRGSSCPVGGSVDAHSVPHRLTSVISFPASGCG
ncbi:hypothetical protein FBUS_01972 [Fasciolopsis buskii]|uniref:Uncharacterized protein n=1 Tax=Fasciolopsis buskii TaxID=27845 RepID=A0A8E0RXA2_9TREM|nr:hypothetical protein FBUS_01972 [Fasciolopsis buski]